MEILAIGDKYFTATLRLAGIPGMPVKDEGEAYRRIREVVEEGRCDALVISEKTALAISKIREDLIRAGRIKPVFIIIPGFEGALKKRLEEIYNMVSQAVGVKLKLGR